MRQIVVLAMAGLCLAACGAGTEDEAAAKADRRRRPLRPRRRWYLPPKPLRLHRQAPSPIH